MTEKKVDHEKLKLNDGWYILRDGIVINRSETMCPIPLGSDEVIVLRITPTALIDIGADEEEGLIQVVHHKNVVYWREPEAFPEPEND